MAFGGCSSTPLPEYNYRASLPERVAVNISVAIDFAADLAARSGLQIVDQSKVTGNPNVDATFAVHLKPRNVEDVSVTVMVNMPSRTIFIGIGGNIESAKAKSIAQDAEALYAQKYPGSKLIAFTRKQGLFGP